MKIINTIIHGVSLFPIVQSCVGLSNIFLGLQALLSSSLMHQTLETKTLENKAWRQIKKGVCRILPILGTAYSIYRLGRICDKKIIEIKRENFEIKTLENLKSKTEKVFKEIKNGEPVIMGQGEYIIFAEDETSVDEKTFKEAYEILLNNAPRKLKKDDCPKRYEIISEKIKNLNPKLKIAFIPRTLYELTYIECCIKQGINYYNLIKQENGNTPSNNSNPLKKWSNISPNELLKSSKFKSDNENENHEKDSWLLPPSKKVGKDDKYNKLELVINAAWRLNNYMIEEFKPSSKGFKLDELMEFTQIKINFLSTYPNDKNIDEILKASGSRGPIQEFAHHLSIKEKRPKVIENACKLDCSPISINYHWIYRGTCSFFADNVIGSDETWYSLSFGTSLLAGSCNDWNACVLYYANFNTTYAIPVPFDKIEESPFHIPHQHPIPQLFGYGEVFHARTIGWKGIILGEDVLGRGFNGPTKNKKFYVSDKIEKETVLKTFSAYKDQAIQLNDFN